jgi:hypothetical protein
MKRIDSLHVLQVRVFRTDEIPMSTVRLENSIHKTQTLFSFKQCLPLQPPLAADPQGAIAFMSGEFTFEGRTYEIDRLVIEPRRVLIGIAAPSTVASAAFEKLKTLIIEIDPRTPKPGYDPLVLTEETTTVVHLDFPITNLFADQRYTKFLAELPSMRNHSGAKTVVVPSSVHFRVSYRDLPEILAKNKVTLLDKDIAIELRVGTDVSENVYFITSPTSTDAHLVLISFIEDSFRQSGT